MDRKVLLTRLGFFVLENEIIDTSSSLTSIFPYYNGLKTPKDSINRTYNQLMVYRRIREPNSKNPFTINDN